MWVKPFNLLICYIWANVMNMWYISQCYEYMIYELLWWICGFSISGMNELWFLNHVSKLDAWNFHDWNDDLVVYWKPWNNCPCYGNRMEFLISVAMIWFLMDMMENCWLDSCWRIWIYGSCKMMNITGMILVMHGMIDDIKCRK